MSRREQVQQRATVAGFRIAWRAVRALPEPAALALFTRVADVAHRRNGKGVQRLRANISRVIGRSADPAELERLTKLGMRTYLRYWCETFRLPAWSSQRITEAFVPDGLDVAIAPLAAGRGVILALPHMGNWDHAGAFICLNVKPFATVAEKLEPAELYEEFVAYRESLGMQVLGLGDPDTFTRLVRHLRAGGLVCLVSERDLGASGIPVRFFDGTARMPAGPAALAVTTGAALVPVGLWYEGAVTRANLQPEIAVPTEGTRQERVAATTQLLADAFAAEIAAHPAHWHMLQRIWVDDVVKA